MLKRVVNGLLKKVGYQFTRNVPYVSDEARAMGDLEKLLRDVREPVIFDVGGHHGLMAQVFRELLPQATIYSFEPFPESFEILKARTASDPRIKIFNYGLGDTEGEHSFHANANSATNSLLATDKRAEETWKAGLLTTNEVVKVKLRTLDAVMQELGVTHVDLLKLDVQGAEPLVMKGGAEACRRGAISVIYSEIITRATYKGQLQFDEALKLYRDLGFDLHNLHNISLTPDRQLRQVDAIFTHGRYLAS